jgi:hypothetical protein
MAMFSQTTRIAIEVTIQLRRFFRRFEAPSVFYVTVGRSYQGLSIASRNSAAQLYWLDRLSPEVILIDPSHISVL